MENNNIPLLTLDEQPTMAQAQKEIATLEPKPESVNAVTIETSGLTEEEKAVVREFSAKIDITDSAQILQYGSGAQKKVSDFSQSTLATVRSKDLGEVGTLLSGLVSELKGFDVEQDKKGIFSVFKKTSNQLGQMKTKYDSVEKNIDKICDVLEGHKIILLKDVTMLDRMYDTNLNFYKELTMYSLAGREKLAQVVGTDLPALQEKARASGKQEDAQAANDLANMCNRFEKKLHDLELTRTICLQMGPQIRLVQSNNTVMVEKIQSSLVNTIPLWKNQMVLSLGLTHSQNAIAAQRQVSDMTNQLLRKNADTLKMNTIESARESERSIVDIETLRHTNEALISTLDEVIQIQNEGRTKRREAEVELQRIESELKNKLLEVRDMKNS